MVTAIGFIRSSPARFRSGPPLPALPPLRSGRTYFSGSNLPPIQKHIPRLQGDSTASRRDRLYSLALTRQLMLGAAVPALSALKLRPNLLLGSNRLSNSKAYRQAYEILYSLLHLTIHCRIFIYCIKIIISFTVIKNINNIVSIRTVRIKITNHLS